MFKICTDCKKEKELETIECDCGSTYFVIGEDINLSEEGVMCNCGFSAFRYIGNEYSVIDKLTMLYECGYCSNTIRIEKNKCLEGDKKIKG